MLSAFIILHEDFEQLLAFLFVFLRLLQAFLAILVGKERSFALALLFQPPLELLFVFLELGDFLSPLENQSA